ncbi:MAG: hypothetical protein KFF50_06090 [Desulfatitalea sp.]|nr:hypothetical protein [Desulfatitalea sp.]
MQRPDIELKLKLPFKMTQRKNWYVANCTVLDVASQGETPAKAKKNLIEALSVFLITCIEQGTLEAVLKECGFTSVQLPPTKKKPKDLSKTDYVDIPLHILASQDCQNRCHA